MKNEYHRPSWQDTELEYTSLTEKVVTFLMVSALAMFWLTVVLIVMASIATGMAIISGWIWGDVRVTYWIADFLKWI